MKNKLSRVVDALPGLVWTALPDGRIDFLNKRWCEYTGLNAEEACGQGWETAIHADDLPEVLDRWHSVLASGETLEMAARLRRFDGTYRLFLLRICPLIDASGQLVRWCGIDTDIEGRMRSEEAMHARWWLWPPAREHHFRSIADDIPGLVVLMNPAGEIELVNRQVLKYLDATPEQLKGCPTIDTVQPDDRADVLARWKEAVDTGRPCEFEARFRRADGVYRWFQTRAFPLRDAEGCIVYWYLLQTDVDDLRRAEALLAGEMRILEMIATGESLPTTLTDLCLLVEKLCTGWACCSILLLDPETGKLWNGASPSIPKGYAEAIDGFEIGPNVGSCGSAAYHGRQIVASDIATDPRWAEFRDLALLHGLRACWSTPIFSQQGLVRGTFALYAREPSTPTRDDQVVVAQVTHLASIALERNRVEENLRRNKAYLSEAQGLSSTGSFGWVVSTDEHFLSDETFRIFEYDPSNKVTLQMILDRIHPQDIALTWRAIALATEGKNLDYECRLLLPSGSVKYLHIVAHGNRDPDGRLECIGAVQDVTRTRLSDDALGKARSELAHVARVTSLGALTASIAHEVNQPLSGIITNANTCLRMLAADPPNIDGARETARRTIRDGNRASDVITRLRALFAKRDVATESVDLNEATREVIALSLSELQRSRVILRPELADDLPPVTGDRVQLQQVILNLLLNASDAMCDVDDRPRQVVIRTEQDEDDRVRLAVEDAGVGVEPQYVDKLFEAFYTTKTGGMGIGLSVSRSIIESHHGRLWAAPNDGPGATFSFSIPRGPERMTRTGSLGAFRTRTLTDAAPVLRIP